MTGSSAIETTSVHNVNLVGSLMMMVLSSTAGTENLDLVDVEWQGRFVLSCIVEGRGAEHACMPPPSLHGVWH